MEKKQTAKQWLDQLEAEGKEVAFVWEGGNDDGSFYLEIDDVNSTGEMSDLVTDLVGDSLSYGSFAGDFSTNGRLVYSEGEFSGTDYYSVSETDTVTHTIKIEVPDHLWFDVLSIDTEGSFYEEDVDVTASFSIHNGPVVPEHTEIENDIERLVGTTISDVLVGTQRTDLNYVYNNWTFEFEDGQVENGKRVFYINEFDFSYESTTENELCIPISDEAEEELLDRREEEKVRREKMMEEWNKSK